MDACLQFLHDFGGEKWILSIKKIWMKVQTCLVYACFENSNYMKDSAASFCNVSYNIETLHLLNGTGAHF